MLDQALNYLKSVRVSLETYGAMTLAAVVGVLLVMLKLQGSKLHAAQVALLEATFDNQDQLEDDRVAKLRLAARAARRAYNEAK